MSLSPEPVHPESPQLSKTQERRSSEDNDPITTISASSGSESPLKQMRPTEADYGTITAEFNVNEETAKNHYKVFKNHPTLVLERITQDKVSTDADVRDLVEEAPKNEQLLVREELGDLEVKI